MSVSVNSELFRTPQRKSTVETVLDKIKDLLLQGKIKAGDRLPNELELTKSLGASRGSIREALKILEAYGVIDIRRGDGTYVSDKVNDRMFDHILFQVLLSDCKKGSLLELRELVETGIAKLVVTNAKDEDLELIAGALAKMESAVTSGVVDAKGLTEADLEFHHAMGKATGNELVEKIYNFILELLAPSIQTTFKTKREGQNALRLHGNIYSGLVARDLVQTLEALRESIDQWAHLS